MKTYRELLEIWGQRKNADQIDFVVFIFPQNEKLICECLKKVVILLHRTDNLVPNKSTRMDTDRTYLNSDC